MSSTAVGCFDSKLIKGGKIKNWHITGWFQIFRWEEQGEDMLSRLWDKIATEIFCAGRKVHLQEFKTIQESKIKRNFI